MREQFLKRSLHFIECNNPNLSEFDKEKINYGLEGLYITVTKLSAIFLIALALNMIKELIVVLLFFNILRFPAFGFHASKSITCFILSTSIILGIPFLLLQFSIPIIIKGGLAGICVISFWLYAPADTKKRPLTNKRKRRIRKISAISLAILYMVILLLIPNEKMSILLLSSLLIETILILPITYRLFNEPYRNYLQLESGLNTRSV